jgi:phosphoribosyl-AMP cyclohydrolase
MQFDPSSLTMTPNGLIPAIAQDHRSGEVLMMAWMNAKRWQATLATGSRHLLVTLAQGVVGQGRNIGPCAGLVEMRLDCDRDCLLVLIRQTGPACHTNRKLLLYRRPRRLRNRS